MFSESQDLFHTCIPWLANKILELAVARKFSACVMIDSIFFAMLDSLCLLATPSFKSFVWHLGEL